MIFKPSRGICSSELDEEMCTLYPWPTAQHQDWAALEGGRMRAVVAYAIRLSRRNATARREPGIYSGSPMLVVFFSTGVPHASRLPEIQALKNVIRSLPGFKAL